MSYLDSEEQILGGEEDGRADGDMELVKRDPANLDVEAAASYPASGRCRFRSFPASCVGHFSFL